MTIQQIRCICPQQISLSFNKSHNCWICVYPSWLSENVSELDQEVQEVKLHPVRTLLVYYNVNADRSPESFPIDWLPLLKSIEY